MEDARANNVILADCGIDTLAEFRQALAEATGRPWQVRLCICNRRRTRKIYNLYRYLQYFLFPLRVFLGRGRYAGGVIIGWQQFFAIVFAFYCRLFRVKKRFRVIVMTIVYKRKPGWRGALYHRFVRYALQSPYIDRIVCTASAEVALLSEALGVPRERFRYVPWGAVDHAQTTPVDEALAAQKLCFCCGRSNRDWGFVVDSLRDGPYPVLIACDTMRPGTFGQVTVDNTMDGDTVRLHTRNAFCALISLDDPDISSGQTILLQAFCFGTPIVITRSKGLTDDYIVDGYNGLVIDKTRDSLLDALRRLHNDPALYRALAENSVRDFHEKYTKTALGRHLGELVLGLDEAGPAGDSAERGPR